jgi:bifunctional non-homologous end joining protein LigD
MSLSVYNKKRNFKESPEPAGKAAASRSGLSFVVQRHKASHLHYDFRLEIGGVLKSWAVPKGPSLNPGDKRLAMMVEDHPYSYKDFAGVIPEGNYGAGIVEIWDQGRFSDLDNSPKAEAEKKLKAGLKAGNLKFRLQGKKLKGEFALVKLKGEQNSWLLVKHKDGFATSEPYNSEEYTPARSAINQWLLKHKGTNALAEKKKAGNKKAKPVEKALGTTPVQSQVLKGQKVRDAIKPMLARETDEAFDSPDWIYELKWDGYRAIAVCKDGAVQLYSRNGVSFNALYPPVVQALERLPVNAVLDGEIVVVDEKGRSDFQLLQHYREDPGASLQFRVFDLLSLQGESTCELPLTDRKRLLKKLLPKRSKILLYSDHVKERGVAFFEAARSQHLEGIMAKKADSLYRPGTRSGEWLKIKGEQSQEAIIAGFTEPRGGRKHFGALVLALREGKKLRYIGHTGSGFNSKSLQELKALLEPLVQKDSPFEEKVKTNMPVTWVKPVLVCEVSYTEWTDAGQLRHPIFLRLRDDKKPADVNLDPVRKAPVKGMEKPAGKQARTRASSAEKKAAPTEEILVFGRTKVRLSNLQKVFWPEKGITKEDVIAYYQQVSAYILPYLKGRPQSLKRNPNGILDKGFFHKDAGTEAPAWVKSIALYSESSHKDVDYIICDRAATLAYLNNLGCIELNPWHSVVGHLDKPDYLIIDIDPSEKNTFAQVIETAMVVQEIFQKAGITSYCKTSGASGLHVYVPAQRKYTYEQLKDFAYLICALTQEQLPGFTSLERNLKKRGKDMIYMDYLQNRRGQTIASVYSLRPVETATVSMPLAWKEVKDGLDPRDFTIHNALKRIEKTQELFSGVLGRGMDMKKALRLLDK